MILRERGGFTFAPTPSPVHESARQGRVLMGGDFMPFWWHNLTVEGPSDILNLRTISTHLRTQGRTALDPRWVLVPTGGVDKIPIFIALRESLVKLDGRSECYGSRDSLR